MKPVIDHIHVTVADLERAEKFYDKFMPLLGFDVANKERDAVPEHEYEIVEYHHSNFSFGIVRPRSACSGETISKRKPGALHHLAFHADSRAEVDRLYLQIKDIGGKIIHEPQLYPEYCKDYYAFFFKDSEEIEYEIVHFNRAGHFPL
jgi:catechol 2,3-dioxygenase-like lactoylglutathione lyase family enzyme